MTDQRLGIVIIGRNEGDRLRACLQSLSGISSKVYVDSGSTDGSVDLALAHGAVVVQLDVSRPFTAARARNAGWRRLLEQKPAVEFVQMVDGDCTVDHAWLGIAMRDLEVDQRRAVVFGRRRERHPDRNAFHRVCDDEWDVPLGEVASCGGDALFRVKALQDVGGYNDALIAGEEPEMCLRLRQRGWRVWSNGHEMTLHDIAMSNLRQWWHRSRRTGFGTTALVDLHGANSDPAWLRLIRSALTWTAMFAVALLGVVIALLSDDTFVRLFALTPLLLVAAQAARLVWRQRQRMGVKGAVQWTCLIMVAKVAQAWGWAQYRLRNHGPAQLIEYKT